MIVYHGSNVKIETIDLAKSEYYRDFGRGFYVTKIKKHAKERAINAVKKLNFGKPIVTEFKYYEQYAENVGLTVKRFADISEEWAKFVVMNRDRDAAHPTHNFDIVEGPIADDKMVLQIQKYLLGKITAETLVKRLKYKEPTHQVCFCTVKSLYALEFANDREFQVVLDDVSSIIIEKIMKSDEITELEATDIFLSSATYAQLATESNLLWKKPWQDLYKMFKDELQG